MHPKLFLIGKLKRNWICAFVDKAFLSCIEQYACWSASLKLIKLSIKYDPNVLRCCK